MRPRLVTSLTPATTKALLEAGTDEADLVRLLVATGAWTERGALDIVRLVTEADAEPTMLRRP